MEQDVFFYWCPSDDIVQVMVYLDREKLDVLNKSYNKILESGVGNFECVKLVKEIITEAERGLNENIS